MMVRIKVDISLVKLQIKITNYIIVIKKKWCSLFSVMKEICTRFDLALHGQIHSLFESLRTDIDSRFSLSLTIVGYVKSSYCIKILIN